MTAQLNFLVLAEQRQQRGCERLQAIVDQRRESFEVASYRRHRDAALKHTRATGP